MAKVLRHVAVNAFGLHYGGKQKKMDARPVNV
jgi:hypothetical protein